MNNKTFVNVVNVVVRGKCRKKITETDQKGTIFLTTQIPSDSENKPRGLYFSKALFEGVIFGGAYVCLLYTSPSPRDGLLSRMPSSA